MNGSVFAKSAGEEPDQHVPARKIGEADLYAILIAQAKGRRLAANFELFHLFPLLYGPMDIYAGCQVLASRPLIY